MVSEKKESTYLASMTREQFMFYEMKITAQLLADGFTVNEIVERVINENLFQYPTEKSCKRMAVGCIRRLDFLKYLLSDSNCIGLLPIMAKSRV